MIMPWLSLVTDYNIEKMKAKDLKFFLALLGVKSSFCFLNKSTRSLFADSLFGVAKILSYYNLENECIVLDRKEQLLQERMFPSILYYNFDFYVLCEIDKGYVKCMNNGKVLHFPVDSFLSEWNGVLLIAEKTSATGEPDYIKNRVSDVLSFSLPILLSLLSICFLVGFLLLSLVNKDTVYNLLCLSVNISGLYISALLLLKHCRFHVQTAETICSAFSRKDCGSLLYSKASSIGGVISWSEIGVSFFATNIILLLNGFYEYVSLFTGMALLYSIWSLLYQFFTRKWCILCVLTQVMILLSFMINIYFGVFPGSYNILRFCLVGMSYLYVGIVMIYLSKWICNTQKLKVAEKTLKRVKESDLVFNAFSQSGISLSEKCPSKICWGEDTAPNHLIVVVNINCNPCADLCYKIMNNTYLLKDLYLQFVLSSKTELDDKINKLLINEYRVNGIDSFFELLAHWFEYGRYDTGHFLRKHDVSVIEQVHEENKIHKNWIIANNIKATPTLLLNGQQVPFLYQIEDIPFLCT